MGGHTAKTFPGYSYGQIAQTDDIKTQAIR